MTETRRLRPLARAAGLAAAAGLLVAACSAGATPAPSPAPSVAPSPSPAASASPTASASPAAGGITVAQSASLGAILVGDGGMTLYVFTNDKGGTSTCTGGCASTWPPLVVASGTSPTAGAGVTGTLGTTARSDGSMQVTYDGSPLYYYAGDQQPGDTNGQGVGGVWFAATPAGTPATGATTGGYGGRYGSAATATPAASG